MTTVAAPVATSAPATNGAASPTQTPASTAPAPAKPGEQAQAPGETQAQKIQRLKLKLGKGKEVEKTPEELERDLQVLEGLRSERGSFQKERDTFRADLEAFQKNPSEYLKKQGISLSELARQEAAREAELAKLTPEQQEIQRYKEEIARRDAAETERTQTEAQQRAAAEHTQLVTNTAKMLDGAIKASGLPRSGMLLKLMADVMTLAEHKGEPYSTPEQVAQAGEKLALMQTGEILKAFTGNEGFRARNTQVLGEVFKMLVPQLQGKALLDFLGPKLVSHIGETALAALKSSAMPMIQETPRAPDAAPQQNSGPRRTEWDVMDALGVS